jgi:hypothetical protein
MFLDAFDALFSDRSTSAEWFGDDAYEAVEVVKKALWPLVSMSDRGASGREIVDSSAWEAAKKSALTASEFLRAARTE